MGGRTGSAASQHSSSADLRRSIDSPGRKLMGQVSQGFRNLSLLFGRTGVYAERFLGHPLLQSNVDRVIRRVAKIFNPMLEGRKPAGLTGLGKNLVARAVLISKAQMASANANHDPTGVIVKHGLFMRPVVNINHLYVFVLKGEAIVLRLDFRGI